MNRWRAFTDDEFYDLHVAYGHCWRNRLGSEDAAGASFTAEIQAEFERRRAQDETRTITIKRSDTLAECGDESPATRIWDEAKP